jgi:AcrR family transcriptional regulator
MVGAHVQVVTGDPARAKVFLFEWTFLGEERRERCRRSRAAYQAYFERVVAEGMAAGELAPGDAKLAAVCLLSALNGIVHWYRPGGRLQPDQLAGGYADLFLGGLRGARAAEGGSPPVNQGGLAARDANVGVTT